MLRTILKTEKMFTGLVFSNIGLESVRHFVSRAREAVLGLQPDFSLLLTVVQILVGLATIFHVGRKAYDWYELRKKRNALIPPPDSP